MSRGVRCPNCGQELKTQLYTPGARLIRCDNCGYTIPIKETETVREYKPESTRPAILSRLSINVITISPLVIVIVTILLLLPVIAGLESNIVIPLLGLVTVLWVAFALTLYILLFDIFSRLP